MQQSMEAALGITEKRGRELIALLKQYQKENRVSKASDRIKYVLEKVRDPRERAFMIWQDGMATQFAIIADVFERHTGVDLSSLMMKLQTGEAVGLKTPDMDELIRSSLICPHCKTRIERCPKCNRVLWDDSTIIKPGEIVQ